MKAYFFTQASLQFTGDFNCSGFLLNGFVDRGRLAIDDPTARLGYVEYSVPDGVDAFDATNWPLWMPALVQNEAVTVEKIATAGDTFKGTPSEWLRAYGNVLTRSDASVFPVSWIDSAMAGRLPAAVDGLCVSVDVALGMGAVSIGVGFVDGELHRVWPP